MRKVPLGLIVAAMIGGFVSDAAGCGDKFLRMGRSARNGRYVAVYPATILVYGPSDSAPARIKDFSKFLKRAGHSTVVVTSQGDLQPALASRVYDLILTGLDQSDEVLRLARQAPSRPDVVPVLIEPSASELREASALSPCSIRVPSGHKNDALAEIDHRMELRTAARRN
jgi:CheY-like chemotaxis protein